MPPAIHQLVETIATDADTADPAGDPVQSPNLLRSMHLVTLQEFVSAVAIRSRAAVVPVPQNEPSLTKRS
jgi:hypothetical protein